MPGLHSRGARMKPNKNKLNNSLTPSLAMIFFALTAMFLIFHYITSQDFLAWFSGGFFVIAIIFLIVALTEITGKIDGGIEG